MQNNLLVAGIACMIAALIGGGLKAFAIEIPLLSSVYRQIMLGLFGAILMALSFTAFRGSESPAPPVPTSDRNDVQPDPEGTQIIVEKSVRPLLNQEYVFTVTAKTPDGRPIANATVRVESKCGNFTSDNIFEHRTVRVSGTFKPEGKALDDGAVELIETTMRDGKFSAVWQPPAEVKKPFQGGGHAVCTLQITVEKQHYSSGTASVRLEFKR